MFERELTDSLFVQRWSIVRTLMPQSIAEHTFLVAHYANDIAVMLCLNPMLHLRLLQRALWHDAQDEIFTGDLPGPNKRGLLDAIGPNAKRVWNAKLKAWSSRVFENLTRRSGGGNDDPGAEVIELILKTADWLEASVRMATETQMGNRCAERHVAPNMVGALETAHKLVELYYDEKINLDEIPLDPTQATIAYQNLETAIMNCVSAAQNGASAGPWITKEDEGRTYKDPCVDA